MLTYNSKKNFKITLLGVLIAALSSIFLSGCTSYFKRKDCEAKNWYQHGFELALKGLRVNNDNAYQDCKKVDAEISESQLDVGFKAGMEKYCQPDTVFLIGKSGQGFNTDLCDSNKLRVLKGKHQEGVIAYCQKENAYVVGTSGNLYTKICPANLEAAFVKEYSRGRKKFLEISIQENERQMNTNNQKLAESKEDSRRLRHELNQLPSPRYVTKKVLIDGAYVDQTETLDPWATTRSSLSSRINQTYNESSRIESEQSNLQKTNSQYRTELGSLDNY